MATDQQIARADPRDRSYVLMTAACNEECYVENTLKSILSQTLLPKRWIIVSDGSTDRTDEIVESYARKHPFIHFLRVTRPPGRNFRSKVIALQVGGKFLDSVSCEFIGNIDADVSVEPHYFESLIHHFEQDSCLGLAAGFVYEEHHGQFRARTIDRVYSVCHAAQLARRQCYEAIGGYAVLKYGGEDWHAQTSAKMKGWHVKAFPGLKIMHYRRTGAADSILRDRFRLGMLAYSFGSDPWFEAIKSIRLIPNNPFFIGALVRFVGFLSLYWHGESRAVSNEFIAFLRNEQWERVSSCLRQARSIFSRTTLHRVGTGLRGNRRANDVGSVKELDPGNISKL